MGIVNADVNEILQAWNNIKTAITSIGATKSTISKKYQQLNGVWKDKKYKELGDVVQECNKALNDTLKILFKGEKYLSLLAKSLQEYESTSLGQSANQSHISGQTDESTSSFGFNGIHNFFANGSNRNQNIKAALKDVEYKSLEPASSERSEQQIIDSISGGDKTKGSCSSLALAYAGNRAGYTVYDFRGGRSREVFSLRSSIEQIANMDGVNSTILRGTNDTDCAWQLMSSMERGREYYMATGQHAAVVRLNGNGNHQYLELQNGIPSENGWHSLTETSLYSRFRCVSNRSSECSNYLIELDSLQRNSDFLNLLGYINTDENAQIRGADGYER